MDDILPATTISPLRQSLMDDVALRRFSREIQRNDIRDVGWFVELPRTPP